MKRIDVVELYVRKRIEMLERENGKYNLHEKALGELNDVIDFINKVNYKKQKQDANKIDAFVCSLSKLNEHFAGTEED